MSKKMNTAELETSLTNIETSFLDLKSLIDKIFENMETPTTNSKEKLDKQLRINDRKGLLVFTIDDINSQWDGTHNGTDCPQAAYVYKIEYTTTAHPRSVLYKVGTVTLVR